MLQWFVDEKVAIGAVKDSCRLIEEEEVELRVALRSKVLSISSYLKIAAS